jgi:hypothetical protein
MRNDHAGNPDQASLPAGVASHSVNQARQRSRLHPLWQACGLILPSICMADPLFENSPYNYQNSPFSYENSEFNYKNSPFNYENSQFNPRSPNAVFDTNGNRIGYEVVSPSGVRNIFDNNGNRIGYKPKR